MKIIQVPFSKGSLGKNDGCELAPKQLVNSLDSIEIKGDNIDDIGEKLCNIVENSKDKLFIIGGDHSITYFSLKGFFEKNSNAGLIVFDAHPDMQSSDFVTHEDYLRVSIEGGYVNPENIILIGVRAASSEELAYLKSKKIIYFDMTKIYELGVKEVCELVMEKAINFDKLYLSIDIDAVDPAFAPGTGYLEPGGISSSDLFYILNRLKNMKNLDIVDLVEINPKKDVNGLTVVLGKKIIEVFL